MQSFDRNALVAGLITTFIAFGVFAQQPGPEQALARAQGLLRQVSAQKQELEIANARMITEIAELETRLKGCENKLKASQLDLASQERATARGTAKLERVEERVGRLTDRLRETLGQLRESNGTLRQTEVEKNELEFNLSETQSGLDDSERKNLRLYGIIEELIEAYRKKGIFAALLQKDPLTGLKDVQIQNLLQEYRIKSQDALRDNNRSALIDRAALDGEP